MVRCGQQSLKMPRKTVKLSARSNYRGPELGKTQFRRAKFFTPIPLESPTACNLTLCLCDSQAFGPTPDVDGTSVLPSDFQFALVHALPTGFPGVLSVNRIYSPRVLRLQTVGG